MMEKCISRKILGERVCNHVPRSTVNQNNLTSSYTVTQGVYTKINVLGSFTVNWVF
jgi:hypothetical protein